MANFDQKLFMFPDEYNELRKELFTHWNPKETGEHPHHKQANVKWDDPRCGWALAFDAELFVEYMNSRLDNVFRVAVITNSDDLRIANICSVFLKELRRRRGERNP